MRRRDFLGVVAAQVAVAYQRPTVTRAPRRRENFNAGWLFQRQKHGGGALGSFDRDSVTGSQVEEPFRRSNRAEYDDSWWEPVNLPHTWNAHDGSDEIAGYFRGIGWYRKHFQIGADLRGKRFFLEFEGVNQVSEFWVNGTRIGAHKGGYTSFVFDITAAVRFGIAANVLTVKVDNLYNPNVSPTVKTDLTFYGGIYRDVWLRTTDPTYIENLYWRTPRVSETAAELETYAALANPEGRPGHFRLAQEIIDPDGKTAAATSATVTASSRELRQVTRVARPRLWSPESPDLYRIRASLFDADRLVDVLEIPLGFRWFSFDADQGFFLNGKRLQLCGTTWHQSYPGMGNALPNSRHVADMRMIREMGCNFFRTSHYPHDPAVIEACDRQGLLVLEELFVGEEIEDTPEYLAIQAKTAEEMVLRDRNNPCIILWGMEGEIDSPRKSIGVVNALVRKVRELDPTRLVTMQDAREEDIKANLDVVGLYSDFDTDDRDHHQHPSRKYLIEEYTAAAIGRGIYGGGENSEDLGCIKHEEYLSQVNRRPWIAGSALWHQFDYDGEEYDPVIPHLVTFGMADAWRIPKDVYFFYQSQWSAKPMIHICGHWTWPGEEGNTKSIKIYSNLQEVELVVNGRSLGVKHDERRNGLEHPPRIWNVPYAPGQVKAIGRSAPQTVVDERKTAGPPARIELRSDVDHLNSGDPESFAYLVASVADKEGTAVPAASNAITFSSYGPGELLPQTWPGYPTGFTWNAVAGKTAIAFRATNRVGRAVISAYSPGLSLGRVNLDVVALGKRDEMEYQTGATVYK